MAGLTGPTGLTGRRRLLRPLLLGLLVVLVNLPLAHSTYLGWRLDRSGIDTTAAVVDALDLGNDGYGVELRLGRDVDPDQTQPVLFARVDRATYEAAERDDEVAVRVLPERPSAFRVAGQTGSVLPWVITGFADLVLLLVALLLWSGRRRARPGRDPLELHLVALGDVERCRPGGSLVADGEATYVVSGEVTHIDEVGIVLDVGDRSVRVDLAGFANPVGYQQPARVRARLTDWAP